VKRTDRTWDAPDRQELIDALVTAGWALDTELPDTASSRNRQVVLHPDGRSVSAHMRAGSVSLRCDPRHGPEWQLTFDRYVPNDAVYGAAVGTIRPASPAPCRTAGELKAFLADIPDHHEVDVSVETLGTDTDGSRWRSSLKGPLTTIDTNPMHPVVNLFHDLPRTLPGVVDPPHPESIAGIRAAGLWEAWLALEQTSKYPHMRQPWPEGLEAAIKLGWIDRRRSMIRGEILDITARGRSVLERNADA
jgi:hypothetical protein